MNTPLSTTDIRRLRPVFGSHASESIKSYTVLKTLFAHNNTHLLFAEPFIGTGGFIRWETELTGAIRPFNHLDSDTLDRAKRVLRFYIDQLQASCQQYENKADLQRLLDACFQIPSYESVYLVGNRPVLTNWGFVMDTAPQLGILRQLVQTIATPKMMINIKAIDAVQQVPLTDALVTLRFSNNEWQLSTNAQGNVSFQNIFPFDRPIFDIMVEKSGFETSTRRVQSELTVADIIFSGNFSIIQSIALQPAPPPDVLGTSQYIAPPLPIFYALTCHVRDSHDNIGLANAQITISSGDLLTTLSTSEQGSARFDNLPNSAEKHIVYVQKTGYGDERLVLHPPFPERMTIDLKAIERGGFRGKRGALTINLQWYTIDDLDLHVIDPKKNEIYHANDTVQYETGVAHLDVDANQSDNDLLDDPQENIYWDYPPAGQYIIVVHNYRSRTHSPVPFRVIILKDSEKIELEGIVTEEKEQWQYILTL